MTMKQQVTPPYAPPKMEEMAVSVTGLVCTSAQDLNEKYDWEDELWKI